MFPHLIFVIPSPLAGGGGDKKIKESRRREGKRERRWRQATFPVIFPPPLGDVILILLRKTQSDGNPAACGVRIKGASGGEINLAAAA